MDAWTVFEIVWRLAVLFLLLALLGAVKLGFNQVIRGLEALDRGRRDQGRGNGPGGAPPPPGGS